MRPSITDPLQSGLPSLNATLLRSLIGCRIESLLRYSWWPAEVAAARCGVPPEMVFSLTEGTMLMHLDDGRTVGASSIPPLMSVVIWLEHNKDSPVASHIVDIRDKFPISASDAKFASPAIRSVLGKQIRAVQILKRVPEHVGRAIRPYEVAIRIECESGNSLVLSHALHNDGDSFSVITPDQVLESLKPTLYELQVIE